jgi:sugar (pentulose or hexulose) kinase
MIRDLVIGIDSSTSATKAIAWDREGRAVAEGRAPVALMNPKPGHFEQDPLEWWSSTATALRSVTSQVDPARIASIAISNQRETFGLFLEDGTPLYPGTVWLDERARAQEKFFAERFGADRVHAITGKPTNVTPCLYRFIWFRENLPEIFGRTHKIAEVHGYLTFKLTGEWATSTASADPMGALDLAQMDWSHEVLDAAGVPLDKMERLVRPGGIMGMVSDKAAGETGLLAGTPVIAGGGDGQCAGAGAGVQTPGRAYVNLGTAVVSGSYGTVYAHGKPFRTMTAVAEEGYIYEMCLRTGTFLVDWVVRDLFQIDPRKEPGIFARLEAEAAASPIGAGGLALVPHWQGCMTPHWDSAARGVIAGLSGFTRRGDLYRAVLEGIALELANNTNLSVAASGVPIDHFVAIGGGAASDFWLQILADATGRDILRSTTVEASSLGAAMAAATGAGWFRSVSDASQAMAGEAVARFRPDTARAARYRELLAIHADLWPTLSAWNARMAAFAETQDA